jgi:hypothetical protein
MSLLPNTVLEPTASVPFAQAWSEIHACGHSHRGSALDR